MNKEHLATFCLLACSVGLALLASEVIVRALEDSGQPQYAKHFGDMLAQYDTLLGWANKPNSVARFESPEYSISFKLNVEGARGPSRIDESATSECRILIIGDSFAFGYPVPFEATVGEVVRLQMSERGLDCDVLTLATVGYSTDQELLLFMRDKWGYRSNVTILMFYHNDIFCNLRKVCEGAQKPVFRLEGDELSLRNVPVPTDSSAPVQRESKPRKSRAPNSSSSALLKIKQWFNNNSRLYHLAYSAISSDRPPVPDEFRVFRTSYQSNIAEAWTITGKLITRFRDAAVRNGGDFILFLIPFESAIYRDEWNRARREYGMPARLWRVDQVELELRELCTTESLDCILPTPRFRREADRIATEGRRLYFEYDKHWTSDGHLLAANILTDHLLAHGHLND